MSVFTSLYTLTSSQSRPFSCLNTNNENSESAAPKTQVQIRNLINFLEYINPPNLNHLQINTHLMRNNTATLFTLLK